MESGYQPAGVCVDDVRVDVTAEPAARHRPDLLGGVTTVSVAGRATRHEAAGWPYRTASDRRVGEGGRLTVTAVPYFAWANRGVGPMRVWLPRA